MIRLASALALVAVGGLVAAPATAAADGSDDGIVVPFRDPNWRVVPSLLAGIEHFNYHESVPAPLESRHNAVLATGRAAVEGTAPGGHFYARASFGATNGSMNFEGTDQVGNSISGPMAGHMSDTEAVLGARAGIGDHVWIGGYTGWGHRTWKRDLSPLVGGYDEQYTWSYVPIGFEADAVANRRLTFSFEAALLYPLRPGNLRAHLEDVSPTYSNLDIYLANDFGGRLRLSSSYALTRELRVTVLLAAEWTSVDQGPQTPFVVNGQIETDGFGNQIGASEPFTYTMRTTLEAGASYAF